MQFPSNPLPACQNPLERRGTQCRWERGAHSSLATTENLVLGEALWAHPRPVAHEADSRASIW